MKDYLRPKTCDQYQNNCITYYYEYYRALLALRPCVCLCPGGAGDADPAPLPGLSHLGLRPLGGNLGQPLDVLQLGVCPLEALVTTQLNIFSKEIISIIFLLDSINCS